MAKALLLQHYMSLSDREMGHLTGMLDDGLNSMSNINMYENSIMQALSTQELLEKRGDRDLVENRYAFTGRELETETGLYYYRARYYDPEVGRFISEDPIGFEGGDLNLYGYVFADPINLRDSGGMAPDDYEIELWERFGDLVNHHVYVMRKERERKNKLKEENFKFKLPIRTPVKSPLPSPFPPFKGEVINACYE